MLLGSCPKFGDRNIVLPRINSFFTVAGNTNPTLLYHDDTRVNWKDKLLAQSLKMAKSQAIPRIKISEERQDRTSTQQMREKEGGK